MKTIYRCDMCGTEFDDWQQCNDHERAHPRIEKTTLDYAGPNDKKPDGLEVLFSNGALVYYTVKQVINWPEAEKENPLATGKED